MNLYECTFPNCCSQCGQQDTPPCAAEHANEIAELQRQVGAEMINITTTVRDPSEWLCIPAIWQSVVEERDNLRTKVASLEGELDCARGNWK